MLSILDAIVLLMFINVCNAKYWLQKTVWIVYMAKLEKNEHTFIYLFIYMKYSVSHFQVSLVSENVALACTALESNTVSVACSVDSCSPWWQQWISQVRLQ